MNKYASIRETNSAQTVSVDVLAVMQDAILVQNGWRAYDLADARAAVAELIDAAKSATDEVLHDGASSRDACDRLIAALARVQGVKL